MWLVALPAIALLGMVPLVVSKLRAYSNRSHTRYERLDDAADAADAGDVESATEGVGMVEQEEQPVCDVLEWLDDARDRIDLVGSPTVDVVPIGAATRATRVLFKLKDAEYELWLDGPAYMHPVPRLRSLAWDAKDAGIACERTALGLEKAIADSFRPRS